MIRTLVLLVAGVRRGFARGFAAALAGPVPEGLILHAAGPTDEGFRIIALWECEEAWQRFVADRLGVRPEDRVLLALSDDITRNPEIGFKETRSVAKLTDYLKAHHFDVQVGVADIEINSKLTSRRFESLSFRTRRPAAARHLARPPTSPSAQRRRPPL